MIRTNDHNANNGWLSFLAFEDEISLSNAPTAVETGSALKVSVSYTADSPGDVVAIVTTPDKKWLTASKKTVEAGSGTLEMTLKQKSAWDVAEGYTLKVVIRDVGGNWKTDRKAASQKFNVTEAGDNSESDKKVKNKPKKKTKSGARLVSFQNLGGKHYMSMQKPNEMANNKTSVGEYEKFEIIDLDGDKVAIKGSNGKYVSSENGEKKMTCTRESIGDTEKFTLVEFDEGVYGIKGNNGKFVRNNMMCDRPQAKSEWSQFEMTSLGKAKDSKKKNKK